MKIAVEQRVNRRSNRICPVCESPFYARPNATQSTTCSLIRRGKRPPISPQAKALGLERVPLVAFACLKCGMAGRGYASQLARGRGKYCSRECQNASRNWADFANPFDPMTPDGAWVLGLWYSDGHIDEPLTTASLTQKDRPLLEHVRAIIAPSNAHTQIISHTGQWGHQSSRLRVTSKAFVSHLLEWGITARKSLTIEWPARMSTEFMPHFVRGVFDGDGCISSPDRRMRIDFASASTAFLGDLSRSIEAVVGIVPRIYTRTTSRCCHIAVTGPRARRLADWMYEGSAETNRLGRKYQRYMGFVNSEARNA